MGAGRGVHGLGCAPGAQIAGGMEKAQLNVLGVGAVGPVATLPREREAVRARHGQCALMLLS
ncbi:hypothetical protein C5E45_20700 [Nocardia nova]|uniref:Uncharacterized protein n=1 Tax=Nocardia nova TaxID=37330 RepID=A0A2S6AMJ5_9NOCA|nr:hypothetical protein C5E45_20700 [Nocardia nova]